MTPYMLLLAICCASQIVLQGVVFDGSVKAWGGESRVNLKIASYPVGLQHWPIRMHTDKSPKKKRIHHTAGPAFLKHSAAVIDDVFSSHEIPWTADIRVGGTFVVCFDTKVKGVYMWFHRVSNLRDPLLKRVRRGVLQFTAGGTFSSVYGAEAHLRVSQYALMDKDGERLEITNRTLPLSECQEKDGAFQ